MIIEKFATECCHYCEGPPVQDLFFPVYTYTKRGMQINRFCSVCEACFHHSSAIVDAEAEQVRYTQVGLPDRCACGRAMHAMLGECPLCRREQNMLDGKLVEARFNRRLLNQLKEALNGDQNNRGIAHFSRRATAEGGVWAARFRQGADHHEDGGADQ